MKKERVGTIFLMLGMFFNPFGFDAIQLILIELTGSLLGANLILYCLSVLSFGLYFLLLRINPFIELNNRFFKPINGFKNKIKKRVK
jgi:hypothetical protein